MKICITAEGKTLDTPLDPRFGRCQYFIFINSESDEYEAIENPHKDGGGAGIQVGQVMAEKKVTVVLTGNVGPNAFQTLQAAQIKVVTGLSGTVKDVYEKYKSGALNKTTQGPTVESHHGMNS
jgi:predicted Fe-Mo cluster-binding NifX family protein